LAKVPPRELLASAWRPIIFEFIRRVARSLQPGQQITSWYRDPLTNQREGGAPTSQHLFGLALDIVGPGQQLSQAIARDAQLIAVQEFDHLHIQFLPAGVLERIGVTFPRVPVQTVQQSTLDRTFT
jgi:hypothetical protein